MYPYPLFMLLGGLNSMRFCLEYSSPTQKVFYMISAVILDLETLTKNSLITEKLVIVRKNVGVEGEIEE